MGLNFKIIVHRVMDMMISQTFQLTELLHRVLIKSLSFSSYPNIHITTLTKTLKRTIELGYTLSFETSTIKAFFPKMSKHLIGAPIHLLIFLLDLCSHPHPGEIQPFADADMGKTFIRFSSKPLQSSKAHSNKALLLRHVIEYNPLLWFGNI